MALALQYVGHRPGASLSYFTGATVDLVPGQLFRLPPEGLVLGRRASADLRIASSEVAPHHCRVSPCGRNGAVLEDLGSTNGTQVDGESVTTRTLRVGDTFTLANGFDLALVEVSEEELAS